MAAFTTSLLVGLALAGGAGAGAVAGAKMAKRGQQGPVTPGPTDAGSLAAPATPPTQAATSSSGIASGMLAANKQKRKARPGSMRDTTSTLAPPKPILRPQTLIGSGY